MTSPVAVLGGGVMGETLLTLLDRAGARDVVVAEPRAERADELAQRFGVRIAPAAQAVRDADLVLVLVKPQTVPALLEQIAGAVEPGALVVSFAAGVRTATFAAVLDNPIIRVMPNTPATIGQGAFGISAGSSAGAADVERIAALLSHGGDCVVVDEVHQDAVTAVSGSGPAYVFYLAEAMIAAGVELGLDEDTAGRLARQTLVGAAALLAEGEDPAELRARVTSPNGTTHAAITTFDDAGVAEGLRAGMRAAAARAAELAGPA